MTEQIAPIHNVEVPSGDVAKAFQLGINQAIHDAWQEGHQQGRKDALQEVAADVFAELAAERERQNAKWGEQNHPNGTGDDVPFMHGCTLPQPHENIAVTMEALAYNARAVTDFCAGAGTVTWADILLEEVGEAFAESDLFKLRAELIQVAAVAVQWVQAIDRGKQ